MNFKYKVHDYVFVLVDNYIRYGLITEIKYHEDQHGNSSYYIVKIHTEEDGVQNVTCVEGDLFKTIDELVKNLVDTYEKECED